MWAEIATLFWLQYKLTISIFRSRRLSDRLYGWRLVGRYVSFLFSIPFFALMGGALAVGLVLLSPRAAYELAMITNVGLFAIWLLLPASYSSQMVERFDLSRLFVYPVRFRSMVVGSTLISTLTMTGLWTALLLLGEIVGLAWHQPLALPLILLGAVPTFALLVLTGRIMEDFFDLVAADRRLRALVLTLFSLPFMLCWIGQYGFQFATDHFRRLPQVSQLYILERLASLEQADDPSALLEVLGLSRLLIWLPPGWATAGMGLALVGGWTRALFFVALSTLFVALLLWAHSGIVRRLMHGAALRMGAQRVRSHTLGLRLPGPSTFWALFRKDWLYLRRSPLPRRLAFTALLSVPGLILSLTNRPTGRLATVTSLAVATFAISLVSIIVNMSLTANYFGAVDREGFAALALVAVDRRQVLVSANLAALLFAGALYLPLLLAIALLSRLWAVLPAGLYLGLCIQIGSSPACNLAAIIGPYRTQLRFSGGRRRGNLWGMLAWFVSVVPVLALTALPTLFWRPGLVLTLPLSALYSIGFYALTLKPLARLLQRREFAILEAVTVQE